MGSLPEERKWGAALGHVDGALTIAAGIDYGDDTIDVYDGSQWSREGKAVIVFGHAKWDYSANSMCTCVRHKANG